MQIVIFETFKQKIAAHGKQIKCSPRVHHAGKTKRKNKRQRKKKRWVCEKGLAWRNGHRVIASINFHGSKRRFFEHVRRTSSRSLWELSLVYFFSIIHSNFEKQELHNKSPHHFLDNQWSECLGDCLYRTPRPSVNFSLGFSHSLSLAAQTIDTLYFDRLRFIGDLFNFIDTSVSACLFSAMCVRSGQTFFFCLVCFSVESLLLLFSFICGFFSFLTSLVCVSVVRSIAADCTQITKSRYSLVAVHRLFLCRLPNVRIVLSVPHIDLFANKDGWNAHATPVAWTGVNANEYIVMLDWKGKLNKINIQHIETATNNSWCLIKWTN